MANLKNINRTVSTLTLMDGEDRVEFPRPYLGMSSIGSSCSRLLQYQWRMCFKSKHPGRILRLFSFGHISEQFIIKDLKKAGMEVFLVDKDGNEQEMFGTAEEEQEEMIGFASHWKGHNDGRVRGVFEAPKTDHLLEMKTHNDKSFKDVSKRGVKASKPVHYSQMQEYMKNLDLTRGLYIAYNKNDSSYYVERIREDKSHQEILSAKAIDIVMSEVLLKKLGDSTYYECRWCDAYEICHGTRTPERHCRNCDRIEVRDKGKWGCSKTEEELSWEDQLKTCHSYVLDDMFKK